MTETIRENEPQLEDEFFVILITEPLLGNRIRRQNSRILTKLSLQLSKHFYDLPEPTNETSVVFSKTFLRVFIIFFISFCKNE